MKVQFLGAGVWARGLTGMGALDQVLAASKADQESEFVAPKPEAIPAKERRRAGLLINLAVEVAHQACEQAGVDKSLVPSVFASAMGDTAITDYMCRKLAAPEKLLSPTKFHNSVHNAPSGYWTISAHNRAPSSFVGGFVQSFGAALLETASQALASSQPVLLVAYDIATTAPFDDLVPVREHLGLALVVAPPDIDLQPFADGNLPTMAPVAELRYLTPAVAAASEEAAAAQSLPTHPSLLAIANSNPIGPGLALLESLRSQNPNRPSLQFAAAPAAMLSVDFC